MTVRMTTKDYDAKLLRVHGKLIRRHPKDQYETSGQPIMHICACGFGKSGEWKPKPNNILNGSGCPACSGNNRLTASEYAERLRVAHNGKISIHPSAPFTKASVRIAHICSTCGHGKDGQWLRLADKYTRGCPSCAGNLRFCRVRYEERLSQIAPTLLLHPDAEWINIHELTPHICTVCDHGLKSRWVIRPSTLMQGVHGCTACNKRYKIYNLGKRQVGIRGYEGVALDWLLHNTTLKPTDIVVASEGCVPTISYTQAKVPRKYYPDFYIKRSNILVEVKSLSTLGLAPYFHNTQRGLWSNICAKAKASLSAGYDFRLLVFLPDGSRLELPHEWFNYSFRRIMAWFNE